MRLLTKSEVAETKSKERKAEIEEGIKLARRVDTLREMATKEEANLLKFRSESLNLIRKDIDTLIEKKSKLEEEVKVLENEVILLSSPIDLVEKWDRVKRDESEVEEKKTNLNNREIVIIAREAKIEEKTQELFRIEEELREKQDLTARFLQEAQQKYDEADKIGQKTREDKLKAEKESKIKEEELKIRDVELKVREKDLTLAQKQLERDILDNQREKIHIASQQETLKKTWDSIKKLQAKK